MPKRMAFIIASFLFMCGTLLFSGKAASAQGTSAQAWSEAAKHVETVLKDEQVREQTHPAQDAPEAVKHIEAAKKIAGREWAPAQQYFCLNEEEVEKTPLMMGLVDPDYPGFIKDHGQPTPEAEKERYLPPVKMFDNLYFVGTKDDAILALTTTDGIILFDAGYRGKESRILDSMTKVGLDPSKVKIVFISNEEVDHVGGAKYFQDHGAHIYMAAAEWDNLKPKPGAAGSDQGAPKEDMVAQDGQVVTLGGESVTLVLIPGHTPGSLGYVFPVQDNGKTHMVGLFGGAILAMHQNYPVTRFPQYLASINHFADITRKMKVDVELQNHPSYDNTFEKMTTLLKRAPGQPNPFVVGETSVQKLWQVMAECSQADIVRRGDK